MAKAVQRFGLEKILKSKRFKILLAFLGIIVFIFILALLFPAQTTFLEPLRKLWIFAPGWLPESVQNAWNDFWASQSIPSQLWSTPWFW